MTQRRSSDPIKAAARKARAQRRVGKSAVCSECGEADPVTLIAGRRAAMCYECNSRKRGNSGIEEHHVAGRKNSPVTAFIRGNLHRKLSAKQYGWRKPMLDNPENNPVIAIAARIQGYVEMNDYLVEELLASIPDELCEHVAGAKKDRKLTRDGT